MRQDETFVLLTVSRLQGLRHKLIVRLRADYVCLQLTRKQEDMITFTSSLGGVRTVPWQNNSATFHTLAKGSKKRALKSVVPNGGKQ